MRITNKHLELAVAELNRATDNPVEPYERAEGRFKANIGNYHINQNIGGVCLQQMMNNGGGVNDVLGRTTKRELYNQIQAMLEGIRLAAK